VSANYPKTRDSIASDRHNTSRFLGRHPPPVQRRFSSLPSSFSHDSPTPKPSSKLHLGGPINRPLPGYAKVPRFVPLEVRLNTPAMHGHPRACEHGFFGHCIKCRNQYRPGWWSVSNMAIRASGSEVPDPETTPSPAVEPQLRTIVMNWLRNTFREQERNLNEWFLPSQKGR